MPFPFTLKDVLKRGALVAAANWPVAIVQATADSLFKLLVDRSAHWRRVPGRARRRAPSPWS